MLFVAYTANQKRPLDRLQRMHIFFRTADLGAECSEGPVSALSAKMCMPQHRSVWVLCLSSLRLTLMSPPAQFPLPPPKNTCRHPPPNLPHWEAVMRGEVLGVERRRRWSDEDKFSILSSIGIDGATVTQVAYRCDVNRTFVAIVKSARGELTDCGQSVLCGFDAHRPLCKPKRTSVRLSKRHAAVLGSPDAQATPSPRSIVLMDAMSASSI